MAIKFQYNKTALQELNKQLRIREKALPTLKNKEAALRIEVKKARDQSSAVAGQLAERLESYQAMSRLWEEFDPSLVLLDRAEISSRKIAGINTPVLDKVVFSVQPYSLFNKPSWYPEGVTVVQELARLAMEKEILARKAHLLERARKKTTQKVNLYEKVQIPGYQDAILKIKRFLEDEENLSKSAQKIVKNRQQVKQNGS